eukprot:GDKK01049368.1.p1 GENE.GDKK01049368.1~~GDKK01049368.1.p1  ORF type:complete len:170 (-),score=44.83 GDKK01049368.1:239-718(-)
MANNMRRSKSDNLPEDWELPDGEGDAKRGQKLYKKHCAQCHSYYPDNRGMTGSQSIGPTLWEICGRVCGATNIAGHVATSFAGKGIIWTDVNLMRYMKNPAQLVDYQYMGMNFTGVEDIQVRKDILAFLKTLSRNEEFGQALLKKKFTNENHILKGFLG